MSGVQSKSFAAPDQVQKFPAHGDATVVTMGGRPVIRMTLEPGWRWSADVKPMAGTDSCQTHHLGYVQSGTMRVFMSDGSTADLGAGSVADIPPGHDAEIIGDEVCVFIDFGATAAR